MKERNKQDVPKKQYHKKRKYKFEHNGRKPKIRSKDKQNLINSQN